MIDFVVGHDRDTFGSNLAQELGCNYCGFRRLYHPDGEPAPRVEKSYDLDEAHVLVVYRTRQRPTKYDVALYIHNFSRVVGTLSSKELFNAGKVDVLMPYYVLGRQDKNAKTSDDERVILNDAGRDVGYKWLAREFAAHGASRILTFNPHFHREDFEPFNLEGLELVPLDGVPALANHVKERMDINTDKYSVMTPDKRAGPLGITFARETGLPLIVHNKKRYDSEDVKLLDTKDVGGRSVFLIDDILSTLGTAKGAVDNTDNIEDVSIFGVHAVLPESGFQRSLALLSDSKNGFREIIATDTVDSDYSKVSIMDEVVKYYKE